MNKTRDKKKRKGTSIIQRSVQASKTIGRVSSLVYGAGSGTINRLQYQCFSHTLSMASSSTPLVSCKNAATNAVMITTNPAYKMK
uniref:Uncharacterized protein n=1 Tax=Nymphaea colorata TaxID=210225 RepID=A0A5K1FVC4_9MAGN